MVELHMSGPYGLWLFSETHKFTVNSLISLAPVGPTYSGAPFDFFFYGKRTCLIKPVMEIRITCIKEKCN